MAGTFEVVFSGLCLFVFSMDGTPPDPDEVVVNLVRTDGITQTSCKDGGEQGDYIVLPPHKPELIIADGSWTDCSAKQQGACSPADMPCTLENGFWSCNIDHRELCVDTDARAPLNKNPGPAQGAPSGQPPHVFDWIAHLKGVGGDQITGLKSDVMEDPLQPGNPLVVGRIRSSHGKLATQALGKKNHNYVIWQVRPPTSYPLKALAEHVSLTLEGLGGNAVRLEDCQNPNDYFWQFKPTGNTPIRVEVRNLALGDCDVYGTPPADDDCTTSTDQYGDRLRHYLWYYELVEWVNNECPTYLPAPVCPNGNCEKDRQFRGDANVLCPPTTYP